MTQNLYNHPQPTQWGLEPLDYGTLKERLKVLPIDTPAPLFVHKSLTWYTQT